MEPWQEWLVPHFRMVKFWLECKGGSLQFHKMELAECPTGDVQSVLWHQRAIYQWKEPRVHSTFRHLYIWIRQESEPWQRTWHISITIIRHIEIINNSWNPFESVKSVFFGSCVRFCARGFRRNAPPLKQKRLPVNIQATSSVYVDIFGITPATVPFR